ncbi:uncharacterized protein LOC106663915 [Cimex lectularius]|uniref:Uncharacterized protein n=1 Tax=Cimex lectularius TaxID=79782 RepID=A0A8I6SNL4_CIMLE|nr:uncharacterized protein LOC106663915 [Cimex lectularius]
MKLERRKKQNQHNAGGNKSLLNKHEQKYNKIKKACVKNMQYLENGFMKYPLTQDQFYLNLQTDFLVNMARNKHDEDVYRLRERKKSSCATGSCSQYDNYLTLRPDFPSENDIRSRRSFYNLSSRKGYVSTPANPDVDVLYESRSDPYKRRSGKNTRQSSYEELDWNSKSELIPLVNSREMGADSHFIQSRLMLRKTKTDKHPSRKVEQKKYEYYGPKENECRIPRNSSFDSTEISIKNRNQHEDENDEKNWNGPLDLPVKTKTPKLSNRRSSPSGNDKNYFAKYTEFVMMKKRQQSISPNKMKNVSCSTESFPKNVSSKKNKRQDLLMEMSNNNKTELKDVNRQNNLHHKINPTKKPLKTSKNEREREAYYENHNYHRRKHSEKYDSDLKHRKLHSSSKSHGTPEKYHSDLKHRKLHSSPKSHGTPEKYDSDLKHRKLHSSRKSQGTPEKYDSDLKHRKLHSSRKSQGTPEKYDSDLKHRKLHSSPKSQGTPNYVHSKSYSKETESPDLSDYSKSRYPSNSKHKDYINKRMSILKDLEENASHRKDTIASSMKYTKKYTKSYDLRDEMKPINDFYAPPDLRSISEVVQAKKNYRPYESAHFLNENINVKEEREKMGSSSRKQERQSTSRTPERKPRQSTYFNSNVKIDNNAGKMRKLDVSSDCGVACDDKETDKYHNIGLKYGRQSVDPALLRKKRDHHRRGYLDIKGQPTSKTSSKKKGLSAPKERVSFKDENLDFRYDQRNNNDYTPLSPSSVARRPCIKNYTNPVGSETCTECINSKKKSAVNNAKDLSICPIDRKYTTNEAAIVETQLTGVPYLKKQTGPNNVSTPKPKQLFNDKGLKKTKSEDLSKNFCHKTVLEKYPDDAEHLRDYSEEFAKQPFRSTQFNPGGHDPPPLKPTFYPKTRYKPYDYSGNLLPDDKRPNDARKLSPTVYVKRQKRELSYKSTIGENFFKHNRSKYIDITQPKEPSNENVKTELSTFKSEVPIVNTKTQIVKNKYQQFHKTNEKHDKTPPYENNYNVNLSAQKNLSFATINEKFRNSDYTESRDRKYDEKLQKSRSGFVSRPNSLPSTEYSSDGRTREMKEPDNDVISTILGPSGKQDSFITSRLAVDRYRHNLAKGNKYEIVYLKEKPPDTPTNEVPNEKKKLNKEYFEPNNREIHQEGFYNKSYSEEQPLDKKEVLPNESSHIFNKQRNLNDSLETSPNQPKEDYNAYHHSNNNKQHDSSNKTATNPSKLESPGPSTDWRMQPKLPSSDFKMYNINPNEVEVAPDEKLLPNMIGHAAMHNWEQAESYFFSNKRSKPIVGSKVKMSPYFRKPKLRTKFEDYDDDEEEGEEEGKEEGEEDDYEDDDDDDDDGDGEGEGTKTNNRKKKKTKKHRQSIPIIITDHSAPVPAKRFKNQRINPHSRFDAGYDFLQTADSNTSIETVQSYTKKLCTSAVKPIKRESAIKRLAKRLFSIKRKESREKITNIQTESGTTESSDEDSPKSIDASSNKPKPKRKVSFSVPLYM